VAGNPPAPAKTRRLNITPESLKMNALPLRN
jgi:hypothetical protein